MRQLTYISDLSPIPFPTPRPRSNRFLSLVDGSNDNMGNHALDINGFTNTVTTNNHITNAGSDWYFTVTSVQGAAALIFIILSFYKRRSQRLFYYITAALTLVSSIAYFAQGSNLGWTAIQVEWQRSAADVRGNMRQIFYARYIDYFITIPLLLLDLLLWAGLPRPTIAYTILISEVWVVSTLIAALVKSTYKWGFFTFGVAAYCFVAYTVVFEGLAYARGLGADISRNYLIGSVWVATIWLLYPIAFGVSEGGNVIAPTSEAVFYGILDILTKTVFGFFILWSLRNVELERLGIHIRDAKEAELPTSEKAAPAASGAEPAPAPTNGVTGATETPTATV